MKAFENFTGLYPLTKTLRFELKPIGKTLEYIEKNGLLDRDRHRANSYVEVKKIIDRYHKQFIEDSLKDFKLKYDSEGKNDSLEEYFYYYKLKNRDDRQKKDFDEIQKNLRKQIASQFKKQNQFKTIDKKELIKEDLQEFVDDNNEKKLINEFRDFTTYFTGFHENRQNMYSEEEKSTAIAYRLIHENLPKFIDNISAFERVAVTDVANCFVQIYSDFEEYLNVNDISKIFCLGYYTEILTQAQIDVYNLIIGGCSQGDVKIKGLNEYINLYNQQQKDKSQRLPKLKPLFKQILSDRNAISWLPESFKSDNELLENLENCYQSYNEANVDKKSIFLRLKELLVSMSNYEIDKIFVRNDSQLTDISQKMFGNYNVISKSLLEDLKRSEPRKSKKETDESYEERLRNIIKNEESFKIERINSSLQKMDIDEYKKSVCDYYAGLAVDDKGNDIFDRIEKAYSEVKDLLNSPYPSDKNLIQEDKDIDKIKNLMESIKELHRFVKPLCGKGNEPDKDDRFYGEFTILYEELDKITPLYNMVRNYLTRKPYSTEKVKLFFENNGAMLNGWVDSKTENSDNGTQYGGYLFRRKNGIGEYDYYLGISSDVKLFRKDTIIAEHDKSDFERLDYYQLKSQTFYGSAYKGNYELETQNVIKAIDNFISKNGETDISEKIISDRANKNSKTGTAKGYLNFIKNTSIYDDLLNDDIFKNANDQLINSLKKTLMSFERLSTARKIANDNFNLFSDLMDAVDVLMQEKVFTYNAVSINEFESTINRDKKPLLLFKITNKDLSFADTFLSGKRKSRGVENLHTLYFKALMSGKQNVFDIGTGSVYFREKSIRYSEEKMKYGHHYDMLKDKFQYPIISNKRYVYDKFQFHLSMVQNYNGNKNLDINPIANDYIKKSDDLHVIGIDRGERHLLYLTVIDMKGNIKKQFSLNEIVNNYNGNTYRTNYRDLLDDREKKRDEERKSWKTIETIKELKEGYLSQVIHKITELMIEYNAIIVLEDLNLEFMRGRQKVEKSVYQKFEKMLIEKLNYLADKKKDPEDLGGILKAYQLTNELKKDGKQSGFLFYTQAWNTSKIDPVTGFVNLFDTRYENIAKSKTFFEKFDSIRFNTEKNWFEFSFDYNEFTTKAEGTKTKWTICTYGKRIESYRNPDKKLQWDGKEINLTEEFKLFFEKYGININSNLQSEIVKQDKKDFFEGLLHLLKLTLQMRNSKTGSDIDYMQSPVADENGIFYNSDECGKSMPENADANGAYNIARKGLMIIDKIKKSKDIKKIDLKISNKEWLSFAQNKPYLKD